MRSHARPGDPVTATYSAPVTERPVDLARWYREHPESRPRGPLTYLANGRERWITSQWSAPVVLGADGRERWTLGQTFGRAPRRDPYTLLSADAYSRVYVPESRGRAIAEAYAEMPAWDSDALYSFHAFRDEVRAQYRYLTNTLGVDVLPMSEDPYADHHMMRADLQRRELRILDTAVTGGHPFLSDRENNMFRAVHDAFGHGATGRGFDRHGEDAAWLSHSRMFSARALPAMTTETRGQNSAMNYGDGSFPVQKIALMPAWATRGATFASLAGDE